MPRGSAGLPDRRSHKRPRLCGIWSCWSTKRWLGDWPEVDWGVSGRPRGAGQARPSPYRLFLLAFSQFMVFVRFVSLSCFLPLMCPTLSPADSQSHINYMRLSCCLYNFFLSSIFIIF